MSDQAVLPRILVYQSEECDIMADYLTLYGFDVILSTENNILDNIKDKSYDLCIFSHYKASLPGNLKALKFLRKSDNKTPVIMVSNLHEPKYVVEAFNAGADDYVAKPYNLDELICRIKAVLKRCGIKTRAIDSIYRIGSFVFNVKNSTLEHDKSEIKLTDRECKVLALLCTYKNEFLSKKILMNNIWTDDNYFSRRSLDVYICHLRNFLKPDDSIKIETKRGLGYSLVVNEA